MKQNNEGNTYGESLYLCDEKLEFYYEDLDSYVEMNNGFKLDQFKSQQSNNSSWINKRYQNGIQFCEMFLKEYFPEQLKDFQAKQGISSNQKINISYDFDDEDNKSKNNKKKDKNSFSM